MNEKNLQRLMELYHLRKKCEQENDFFLKEDEYQVLLKEANRFYDFGITYDKPELTVVIKEQFHKLIEDNVQNEQSLIIAKKTIDVYEQKINHISEIIKDIPMMITVEEGAKIIDSIIKEISKS